MVFIDDGAASRSLIRQNIDTLGVIGQTKLWRRDATRLGVCRSEPFDLIFADPPYDKGLGVAAINAALDGRWIAPGAVIVLEESAGVELPDFPELEPCDDRSCGETRIRILKAAVTPSGP